MKTLSAIAPAKVNLLLKVEPLKSGQVLHNVRNIMHTISLHDTLCVTIEEASQFSIDININFERVKEFACGTSDNLITKAAKQFFADNNIDDNFEISVSLTKRVPAFAGLGGGSSDAAAMLIVLSEVFSTKTPLEITASKIGADVVFFLQGGHQEMTGAGDHLSKMFEPIASSLVLVMPTQGMSTASIYSEFEKFGASLNNNDLQNPAISLCSEIGEIIDFLPQGAQMTGSGSCVFYLCETFSEAARLASAAQLKGWWSRACSTIPTGAKIL